jgi:hypothetical protein
MLWIAGMSVATPQASAAFSGVKMFAKSGEANKPRHPPSYILLQSSY